MVGVNEETTTGESTQETVGEHNEIVLVTEELLKEAVEETEEIVEETKLPFWELFFTTHDPELFALGKTNVSLNLLVQKGSFVCTCSRGAFFLVLIIPQVAFLFNLWLQ